TLFLFSIVRVATTYIDTLSLHDALPICQNNRNIFFQRFILEMLIHGMGSFQKRFVVLKPDGTGDRQTDGRPKRIPASHPIPKCKDRKSTRLNSSHVKITYAVF